MVLIKCNLNKKDKTHLQASGWKIAAHQQQQAGTSVHDIHNDG
jgi:hypothetical protein